MKAFTLFTIIYFLGVYNLKAQQTESFGDEFDRAEKIFEQVYQHGKNESLTYSKDGYADARILFSDLYKKDTSNTNVAFKLGVCFLSSRSYRVQAIPYFKKATTSVSDNYKESSNTERNAPLIAYKFLGDAYHLNYQFDNAIEAYDKYIAVMAINKDVDKVLLAETKRKIEMCHTGKRLVQSPIKVKIETMGNNVNSTFADYSPVLSADQKTFFFTSRRSDTKGGQKDPEGNYMEDIYRSTKTENGWSQAVNIGSPINTYDHEASVGISPDGQTILIYKDDKGDGNIYTTSLNGDVWSVPVKLNDNINSKYWEPSAFISADGNTLYFTSNKPGGYGGRDLYKSNRSPDGDWEKSVNLGPSINTPFDEDAPFIHPDGVTLSFSSNGHGTMGGFDIFISVLSDAGVWSEPMNVGYPLNTTDDDIFYVISPNSRTAYFSSFREGGLGEKDNYMATFLEKKETPLILVKGFVFDEGNKPAQNVVITVTDNETEQVIAVYHANPKTGQFLFILPPGKNYNITYKADKHLFYSENMEIPKQTNYKEINKDILLPAIIVGSKIVLNNIFFDFDKATLRPLSNVELKNLVQILKANPTMKVEISGHTDSKGSAAYNQKLSEQRAQAVVTRLTEKGIDADRMQAKGYGKSKPSVANQKADGSDDPEGRQLNRRVELKITEID